MELAETFFTVPDSLAKTHTPESIAALCSMPVPTIGDSVTKRGTACRCIFAPISARLASSFSKNGIKDVATETTIFGQISM